MKAQVSAELMIVIAAVLAVAVILVAQLQQTAKQGRQAIERRSRNIFKAIEATEDMARERLKKVGKPCRKSSECETDFCDPYTKTCEWP